MGVAGKDLQHDCVLSMTIRWCRMRTDKFLSYVVIVPYVYEDMIVSYV